MAPKTPKTSKPQQKSPAAESPKDYPTIAEKLEAEYLASRPYLVLAQTKGLSNLTPSEKSAYALSRFLETGVWDTWPENQQQEFWKSVKELKIPTPLPKPGDLGRDRRGRDLAGYPPEEYRKYLVREREIEGLRKKSEWFCGRRDRKLEEGERIGEEEIQEERNRRKLIGNLEGKRMKKYEGDPEWDDVVPVPQVDGEGALAQIAYTEEYDEAMGILRAIMAAKEYSPRVLSLTEHIIHLNPAHYTVWLYRARTILALNIPIPDEITWLNEVALENLKNYQIWSHRQVLIDNLYTTLKTRKEIIELGRSEREFMEMMFDEDEKNYHVWSYRQYLVKKFDMWDDPDELLSIENLLKKDVRNNSAWSHRFFLVFSNPRYSTEGSRATEFDGLVPDDVIDTELEFAKAACYEAPMNLSPWNYLRGVLRKGGRGLESLEGFASEFAVLGEGEGEGEGEDVKSSHALDFLVDVWVEKGEKMKADQGLRLLGDKYDRIRKNYYEWRRGGLKAENSGKDKEVVVI